MQIDAAIAAFLCNDDNRMKFITTLSDKDIFPEKVFPKVKEWENRSTVKIVLVNDNKEIALVTNSIHKCFLLPGGGIEKGEDLYNAADRECQEEVKFAIVPIDTLGAVEEYKARDGKRYETFGVFAKAKNPIEDDLRTEDEKNNNLSAVWWPLDKVEKRFKDQEELLRSGKIDFYNTGFNIIRDAIFVKVAKERGFLD